MTNPSSFDAPTPDTCQPPLDQSHGLDRERLALLLIEDAIRGLADVMAGRTVDADTALCRLQQRRARPSRKGALPLRPLAP